MQNAKNAVKEFMNQDGKHTTNVHESMGPAVTNEKQHTHHHSHEQTAIDREVHQDHYHTTVQPVKHREVLDEQHHHKIGGVEHRKFEHGDDDDVRRRLDEESAKYVDTQQKGETRHTSSAAPTVTGEHVHHHIHEKIVPVVEKDVIQPHVTHSVVPIKETHHNAAHHHSATTLPAVTMDQFQKQGGALGGREERSDFFEGEPRHMGGVHATHRPEDASNEFRKTGHVDTHGHSSSIGSGASGLGGAATGTHGHHGHHGTTGSGVTGSSTTGSGLTGSNTTGSGLTGSNTTGTSSGLTGTNSSRTGGVTGGDLSHGRNDSTGVAHDTTSASKPSLLSRLNPLKDSDGDGKKGIMD